VEQAQRYHWFDFISSQSTMHCLLKFDIASQCVSDTDPRVIEILKLLVDEYQKFRDDAAMKKTKWRQLLLVSFRVLPRCEHDHQLFNSSKPCTINGRPQIERMA
jgi:hypothetical protein